MSDKLITFKGKLVRKVFDSDDFKMFAIDIDKSKYPDLILSKYGNVTIQGDLFDLKYNIEYDITVENQYTKYGYKVKNISFKKPTTAEEMFIFLNEILTSRQAETLYEHYPDIVDRVKENRLDDIDLNKLKGIKEKTFAKIVKKITENFCLADLVIEFQGYISLSVIKKMYDVYTSVENLREHLQKDAYKSLCSIGGIGFKKADAILLEIEQISKDNIKNNKPPIIDFKEDLKTSSQRCKACLINLLEENENNGHTQMNLADLRSKCMATTKECADKFTDVLLDKEFYYNKEHMEVSLRRTYAREYSICKTLYNALSNNIVWDVDIEKYRNINGSTLSDEQISTLEKLSKNNIVILNGSAGCVDCDTEYFNGYEWKKISEYTEGERVLQYNEDGTANLVYPHNYIKNEAEYLWHFETTKLNQCLSDEHTVVYKNYKNDIKSCKMYDFINKHNKKKYGNDAKFITSYEYGGTGINLSDNEIRLMVAIFADGYFHNTTTTNRCTFAFTKQRKINRSIDLLNKCSIKYKLSVCKGITYIYFDAPIRAKFFTKEWYNCTNHQFKIIMDEYKYWDNSGKKYVTTNYDNAVFMQFAFSSCGYRASIYIDKRKNVKDCYYVLPTTNTECTIINRHKKTEITKYKTLDGYEYCFTVPSHMLVLRRNNKIFITGNCGKSYSLQSVLAMLKELKKSYRLLAPTGRASKVIAEYTNENAMTIHRGLGYVVGEGFIYNKDNKLGYDVIIVDEFSMIDLSLMKSLVDAIDFTKTKLLMIGDSSQLPSVGCGNVLHDLMQTKIIPTTTLTKVFRYSEGGLMKVATDVRLCQQYLSSSMKNKATTFGNNKDYTFIDVTDDKIVTNIVELYKKLLSLGKTVNDIQVLTSKNVGDCGAIMLNNEIQKVANPNYNSETKMIVNKDKTQVIYYVGDLIIQTANNYKAIMVDEYGNEIFDEYDYYEKEPLTAFIANGELGVIKEIYTSYMIINFDGVLIKYYKNDLTNIALGYSITFHKSQGSGINTVILATPKSHTFMLNSNLIYVGLTRMKERCFHLGNLNTVNSAIKQKANLSRNTFTQRLLTDMKNGIEVDVPYQRIVK